LLKRSVSISWVSEYLSSSLVLSGVCIAHRKLKRVATQTPQKIKDSNNTAKKTRGWAIQTQQNTAKKTRGWAIQTQQNTAKKTRGWAIQTPQALY
jgi:hypothetical protein